MQSGTLPCGLKQKIAAVSNRVGVIGSTPKSNVLEKLFQNIRAEANKEDSAFKSLRLNMMAS